MDEQTDTEHIARCVLLRYVSRNRIEAQEYAQQ